MPAQIQTVASRVRSLGVRASTSIDLAAIGFSRREEDAVDEVGKKVLARFRSIRGLGDAGADELKATVGFESFEALRAQALMELGRRSAGAGKGDDREVLCAADVFELYDYLRYEKREHFCIILLDTRGRLMRQTTIHIGTLNMSVVGPREVFREAVREGAASIIAVHNHPSGDPEPSPEDIEVTRKLKEVGELLDIPLVDHVIIGERGALSLRDRGLL